MRTTEKQETWKLIEGYEEYEVSDKGRVRRIEGGSGTCAGKILTPLKGAVVRLSKRHDSTRGQSIWQVTVPELVLLAFEGDPPFERSRIGYKDGDTANRSIANLSWYESARASLERTKVPGKPGRPKKARQLIVTEYLAIIKALPKAAWPAITLKELMKRMETSTVQSTIARRLKELVEDRRVTIHLDGIEGEGVSSPGRRVVGYRLAAYPLGVLTDFSEMLEEGETKRVRVKLRKRSEEVA